MVTTPVDTLRRVLRHVPGRILTGLAELYVNDEAIASDLMPRGCQILVVDPRAFAQDVQVDVPAVVTSTPLDFDEEDAALLTARPQATTTELCEPGVQSIDVFGE